MGKKRKKREEFLPEVKEEEEECIEPVSNIDPPEGSIAIKADEHGNNTQYDVIVMDPPWQLAGSMPTRGVALSYQQLTDSSIANMPIPALQSRGYLFIWVINNKFMKALEMFRDWGYEFVDEIVWVKHTKNRRLAKCHGYYLQHAKETCLVGRKVENNLTQNIQLNPTSQTVETSDVIFSLRKGQSEKPEELYKMIEQLVPNGKYLEIFGRRNNLRSGWTTMGNEL